MNRSGAGLGIAVAGGALALALFAERDAAACGGCFHPPTQTASDITDERMLLSVSPLQTTLYDQIEYAGTPSSFAWVLPIHGTVDVGLSADVLFDSVDTLTATQITAPNVQCPSLPSDCQGESFSSNGATASAPSAAGGGVTVTKQQQVGPYETVQLHATDSSALNNWLAQNGFSIPAAVTPVIDAYVTEGFDFLAMKLLPDQGVQAMRPVRVTMPGASVSLPLRMAAIGTGATVGITIWVVSDGRYEPQNFPFFHIDDSSLIWDFSTESSNYTALRAQNEAALGGKGWEIESSISLNEQLISNVILSGGQYYGGGGGGVAQGPPSDANQDYLPIGEPEDGGADGGDDGGASETAEQVRAADIAALFAGMTGPNVQVTRIRSDISHAAMTTDFVLQASADQSELSNIRQVTQSINLQCPIYLNCAVVGYGSPAQAAAAGTGGGGGCVASAKSNREPVLSFGAIAGMVGLVVARVVRGRRRAKRTRG
jgi:Uncharacterized protein conserved in bacteria (DUF2330)